MSPAIVESAADILAREAEDVVAAVNVASPCASVDIAVRRVSLLKREGLMLGHKRHLLVERIVLLQPLALPQPKHTGIYTDRRTASTIYRKDILYAGITQPRAELISLTFRLFTS